MGTGEWGDADNYYNVSVKDEMVNARDKRFLIPPIINVMIESLSWIWQLILISGKYNDYWLFSSPPGSWFELAIFSACSGMFLGIQIITCHELIHNKDKFAKAVGFWGMTKWFHSHFIDEHVAGHHAHVGTPNDPSSARKNEPLYYFLFRCHIGQVKVVWDMEVRRIKKQYGENVSSVYKVILNKYTLYLFIYATILFNIYYFLGMRSVIF